MSSGQDYLPGVDSTEPVPPVRRHALGLPAGSVRAILSLMVVALVCVLILASSREIPAYLIYLLFIVLGHFFAAHGQSISRPGVDRAAPLYMPSGFIRLLIVVLLVGTLAWKLSQDAEGLQTQMEHSAESLTKQPLLPLVLLGGFFLGIILHLLVGRQNTPYWFEDIEAWVALLAVIGLVVDAMVILVINPSLKDKDPLTTHGLQGFIAAAIAFYFGARS
jgi:hypothetical protein